MRFVPFSKDIEVVEFERGQESYSIRRTIKIFGFIVSTSYFNFSFGSPFSVYSANWFKKSDYRFGFCLSSRDEAIKKYNLYFKKEKVVEI
jgi:hypothetical protein